MEQKIVFLVNFKFSLMKMGTRWKESPLGEWNHVGLFLIFGVLKDVY